MLQAKLAQTQAELEQVMEQLRVVRNREQDEKSRRMRAKWLGERAQLRLHLPRLRDPRGHRPPEAAT